MKIEGAKTPPTVAMAPVEELSTSAKEESLPLPPPKSMTELAFNYLKAARAFRRDERKDLRSSVDRAASVEVSMESLAGTLKSFESKEKAEANRQQQVLSYASAAMSLSGFVGKLKPDAKAVTKEVTKQGTKQTVIANSKEAIKTSMAKEVAKDSTKVMTQESTKKAAQEPPGKSSSSAEEGQKASFSDVYDNVEVVAQDITEGQQQFAEELGGENGRVLKTGQAMTEYRKKSEGELRDVTAKEQQDQILGHKLLDGITE